MLARQKRVAQNRRCDDGLTEQLVARWDALRVLRLDLEVVVEIADDTIAGRYGARGPHERVAHVAPEDRGHEDGDENQGPAHGRCACLLQVRLGPFRTDDLPDLLLLQRTDEPWRDEEREQHRRHRRGDDSEGYVAKDVQPREPAGLVPQGVKQLVNHRPPPSAGSGAPPVKPAWPCARTSAARTRSTAAPREPLSSTASPPARSGKATSAPSSELRALTTRTPLLDASSSARSTRPPQPTASSTPAAAMASPSARCSASASGPSSSISPRTATRRRPSTRASSARAARPARMLAGF